jgi:cytochrome c oxidase cbb3-type subunit III
MSSGWSIFVIVLTIVNILACVWLLRWTARPKHAGEKIGDGSDTGHTWDGDLREYNNPLPRWWLWVFYITVVFGLVYLVLFPGLGGFGGLKGWSQSAQYQQERAAVEARAAELLALATAHNLFQNNCAQCHGSDGGGARGFPNLANDDWQWGGDPDSIVQSIAGGRVAVMTPWGEVLGDEGVAQVVAYVQQLSGQPSDTGLAAAGATHFQTFCAACHGLDGKGMAAVGAPNLTDGVWLYGGDAATIHETVVKGRNGQMPAFAGTLGEQRVRLLAAYVLRMSGGPK